jgi:hypothetical protein
LFDGDTLGSNPIYHYTNSAGFLGIVTRNQLWATDYTFLNDPSEHTYGHNIVKQVILELKEKPEYKVLAEIYKGRFEHDIIAETFGRSYYIVSFTENNDSEKHWKEYGNNGNGFAVEFSPSDEFRMIDFDLLGDIPHKLIKIDRNR